MGQIGSEMVTQAIFNSHDDGDLDIHDFSISLLAAIKHFKDASASPQILTFVNRTIVNPDTSIQWNLVCILESLAVIGSTDAKSLLEMLASAPNYHARKRAQSVLKYLHNLEIKTFIDRAIATYQEDNDWYSTRQKLSEYLGADSIIDELSNHFTKTSQTTQTSIAKILTRASDPGTIGSLNLDNIQTRLSWEGTLDSLITETYAPDLNTLQHLIPTPGGPKALIAITTLQQNLGFYNYDLRLNLRKLPPETPTQTFTSKYNINADRVFIAEGNQNINTDPQ